MRISTKYLFGPFEVHTGACELFKGGTRIKLRGQPYRILELLLSHAGEVVSRDEFKEKLWPGNTFVDFEHGLNTAVKKLRQALCDSAEKPLYIETLPRLGYRFIAPVAVEPSQPSAPCEKIPDAKSFPDWRDARLLPYAGGVVLATSALLARGFLNPLLGDRHPYPTMWVALVIAAVRWRVGPAIAALVTGALGIWYWFLPPRASWAIPPATEVYGLAVFLLSGLAIIVVTARSREFR